MDKYTARMVHNKDTITRLSVTQYNCFEFKKKLVRIVLAALLILYGLYADQQMFTPIFCLVLGCLLIANVNLRPRVRAGKVIEQMHGNFPKSYYHFKATGFSDAQNAQEVPYSRILRLVEDREYLYLYVSTESAYMVDKSTVSGTGADALKEFLRTKTGKKWTRPATVLNFSIRNLRDPGDGYQGPRLKG